MEKQKKLGSSIAAPHFRSQYAVVISGPIMPLAGSAGFLLLHKLGKKDGVEEFNVAAFVGTADAEATTLTPTDDGKSWIVVDISPGWSVNNGDALVTAWTNQFPDHEPPPIIHGKP